MIFVNLQLASKLDDAGVTQVVSALRTVTGVGKVEAKAQDAAVGIHFDQDLTSPQELGSVLARNGFPEKQGHSSGGCCGSCGG